MTKWDETRVERFWSLVDKQHGNGCWLWRGTKTSEGYGQLRMHGKRVYAHRFSLSLSIGRSLDPREFACHHCDNPPCVRPDHLFLGSSLDNLRDASAKGRIQRWMATRDRCKNGHPYTPENTHINPRDGSRRCRACGRERAKRYKHDYAKAKPVEAAPARKRGGR